MTFEETFFKAMLNEWHFQRERESKFFESEEFGSGYRIGLAFIDLAVENNQIESTEVVIGRIRKIISNRTNLNEGEISGAYAAVEDLERFLKRANDD